MKAVDTLFFTSFSSDILPNLFCFGLDLRIERSLDSLRERFGIQLFGRDRYGTSARAIYRVAPEFLVAKEWDDDGRQSVSKSDGRRARA